MDLYVLERAFRSTHPDMDTVFSAILEAYFAAASDATAVRAQLEKVRARGRKRTAFG